MPTIGVRQPNAPFRLLCVLAHPDDESLGTGGTLARYAAEGVETFVVTATRGERGRFGTVEPRPADEVVGKVREAELRTAASVLGVKEVSVLDYLDAELDQAPAQEVIEKIAGHICRIRPQVIVTFGPDGAYGHPDHIAISQFTAAAIVLAAAGPDEDVRTGRTAHAVSKFYHITWDEQNWTAYQSAFKKLSSKVDGVERLTVVHPSWLITTLVDASAYWETVWRAVQCHKTQMSVYGRLSELTPDEHKALWGRQAFYRVFSTVNGGRARESDLFAGLR